MERVQHIENQPVKRFRILELDALRGIAAFMVVVFHYTTYYDVYFHHTTVTFRFWHGATGVSLFFIISGFVIFMTLERTASWKDFVVSRFSRLYPAYWCALLITTSVVVYTNPGSISIATFLANLTMFQRWLNIKNIDWSYWTLYVELAFYISMALVLYFKKMKYVELYGAVVLGLFILLNGLLPFFPLLSKVLTAYPMLKWGNLFYAGILFYKLKKYGHSWWRHSLIAVCCAVEYLTRYNGNYTYLTPTEHMLVTVAYFVVFYLLIYGKLGFLVNKFFLFIGTISYSWYLIHQNMGYEIIKWLYQYTLNPYLIILIPTAISALVAIGITYLVEKPALALLRGKYRPKKEGVMAQA